jgi:hypothetical protein
MADVEQSPRLRPAYVLASTLAAVTGAFLASRLGVYGTVVGVGVMSLVTTLGTDVYVRSLDRTRQVAARPKVMPSQPPRDVDEQTVGVPRATETAELPDAVTATDGRDSQPKEPTIPAVRGSGRWTRGRVSLIAAGAVVSGVLALVVITSLETLSGSSLSGGARTTLGELVSAGPAGTDSVDDDLQEPPAPSVEPDTPKPSPTPTPSETPEPDGAEQPDEEAGESETPAESSTPTPSPTGSPSPDPTDSSAAGEGSLTSPSDQQQ